jgi:hypothetical protein
MYEVPVFFYSVSPHQVKRTTLVDGLLSIATILWLRVRARPATLRAAAPATADPAPTPASTAR